jgi:hypothetical protein
MSRNPGAMLAAQLVLAVGTRGLFFRYGDVPAATIEIQISTGPTLVS